MTAADRSRLPLDAARLVEPGVPGMRVEVVDRASSTNALVAARAREGEPARLVLVAEHQTAGRGRLDRTWDTPARAALTFSVLVRADVPPDRWPWLPLLTGVAVCAGIEAVGGPVCLLKWPNDVLHDGRKLAGILAEQLSTRGGSAAVVGVGLNVSQSHEELPVPGAVSLATAGFAELNRTDLLLAVLRELDARLRRWSTPEESPPFAPPGPPSAVPPIASEYLERMDTLGRPVRVHLPGGATVDGLAVGVSAGGALELNTPRGPVVISAGDVVHVRPA